MGDTFSRPVVTGALGLALALTLSACGSSDDPCDTGGNSSASCPAQVPTTPGSPSS